MNNKWKKKKEKELIGKGPVYLKKSFCNYSLTQFSLLMSFFCVTKNISWNMLRTNNTGVYCLSMNEQKTLSNSLFITL